MANLKPVICTLTLAGRAKRGLEWREVVRRAAKVVSLQNGVTMQLRGDRPYFARIEELVRSERACCEWMNIELCVEPGGDASLTMTADSQEGVQTLKGMLGGI